MKAYREGYRFVINSGGSRCFAPNQLVWTTKGPKPIKDIEKGDIVRSYNEETKQTELKPVLDLFKNENEKKSLRVTLKDGRTIEASEDHKFYYKGGWVSLKHIVSLYHDKMENNKRF